MSQTTDGSARSLDESLLDQTNRRIAEVKEALGAIQRRIEHAAELVEAIQSVGKLFATVAERLSDVTCRTALETTQGKSPHDVAVALVAELANIAADCVRGTHALQRGPVLAHDELVATLPALQAVARTADEMSRTVAMLSARMRTTRVRIPSVVVETRMSVGRSTGAASAALETERRRADREALTRAAPRGPRFNN